MNALRRGFATFRTIGVRPLLSASPKARVGVALLCENAAGTDSETTEPKGRVPKEGEVLRKGDLYPDIGYQTSLQYMDSEAYRTAYGDDVVWRHYRRNFKGHYKPETRKTCIRGGVVSAGNPCPICRDEYLVIHYTNVKLLNQFISPYTGEILPSKITGICQKQLKGLRVAVQMAQDHGLIETAVPFKKYNYADYLDIKPS
ncbi:small ribosomal subunit protein mS40-like [Liolophura sinensis]|uniref:small ribosomal subunit protein mS40-like n=1 Tax=Liolophura sinensis TaxID=3198878 RepID=UPI00315882E6